MFPNSPAIAPMLLDRKQAAALAGMSESWLRTQGSAPRLRLGNRVRYERTSFLEWLLAHSER
jgi:hypothetical protein